MIVKVIVTPEVVKAVQQVKCFACGAWPWDACKRPASADCGREYLKEGTREPGPTEIEVSVKP